MTLSAPLSFGLIASILLVSLPHSDHLPPWVVAECGMLLAWRAYLTRSGHTLPPRWLLFTLTLASTGGIVLEFHTLLGRDAGVTLLVLLTSLKLLEVRTPRDVTVMLNLACFIIITNFFYSQTIPTALFMLFTLLVILATWLQLYTGSLPLKPRLRLAATLLLQAIPFTLLLFVLFPRVQGPLWGMPQDAYAQSGLTDSMAPGSMSKLSLSEEVAFRVNFNGPPPPHERMYWRGPVLWDFDGTTWRAGPVLHARQPELQDISAPLDYSVMLEPNNKNWLFALELPVTISVRSYISDDYQIFTRTPVTARMRYTVHSQLNYRANVEESPSLLRRALQLPAAGNPRARQLAAAWRDTLPDKAAIINAAVTRFNREGYVYTLEPPLLGANPVDEFLFDSKQGFCEHYASAFVFLMRAAGIPARVVTGYQGGEYNALGDYTIVRQSDAHAWAEVWLRGQGWKRVDPTAAIAPERVNSGLGAAIPNSAALPFVARFRAPWLFKLRFNLDLLNYQWNQWVLGYNSERQFAFLTRLGMEDVSWRKMGINLLLGTGVLTGLFALLMLRRLYQGTRDPVQAVYLRFCRKLAGAGILRAGHEGPQDFAARAAARLPRSAPAIHDITGRYLALRYGGSHGDAGDIAALRHAVRAFKL